MDIDNTRARKTRPLLLGWLIISVLLLIELFIETYPNFPSEPIRWLIVLIGPPVWFIFNLVAEKFIGRPMYSAVSKLGEVRLRRVNTILLSGIIALIVLTFLLVVVRSILE